MIVKNESRGLGTYQGTKWSESTQGSLIRKEGGVPSSSVPVKPMRFESISFTPLDANKLEWSKSNSLVPSVLPLKTFERVDEGKVGGKKEVDEVLTIRETAKYFVIKDPLFKPGREHKFISNPICEIERSGLDPPQNRRLSLEAGLNRSRALDFSVPELRSGLGNSAATQSLAASGGSRSIPQAGDPFFEKLVDAVVARLRETQPRLPDHKNLDPRPGLQTSFRESIVRGSRHFAPQPAPSSNLSLIGQSPTSRTVPSVPDRGSIRPVEVQTNFSSRSLSRRINLGNYDQEFRKISQEISATKPITQIPPPSVPFVAKQSDSLYSQAYRDYLETHFRARKPEPSPPKDPNYSCDQSIVLQSGILQVTKIGKGPSDSKPPLISRLSSIQESRPRHSPPRKLGSRSRINLDDVKTCL